MNEDFVGNVSEDLEAILRRTEDPKVVRRDKTYGSPKKALLTEPTKRGLKQNIVNELIEQRIKKYNAAFARLKTIADRIDRAVSNDVSQRRVDRIITTRKLRRLARKISKHGAALVRLEAKSAKLQNKPKALKVPSLLTHNGRIITSFGDIFFEHNKMMKKTIKEEVSQIIEDKKMGIKGDLSNLDAQNLSEFVINKLNEQQARGELAPEVFEADLGMISPYEAANREIRLNPDGSLPIEPQKEEVVTPVVKPGVRPATLDLDAISAKANEVNQNLRVSGKMMEIIENNPGAYSLRVDQSQLGKASSEPIIRMDEGLDIFLAKKAEEKAGLLALERLKSQAERAAKEFAQREMVEKEEPIARAVTSSEIDVEGINKATQKWREAEDRYKAYSSWDNADPKEVERLKEEVEKARQAFQAAVDPYMNSREKAKVETKEEVVQEEKVQEERAAYEYSPDVETLSAHELVKLVDPERTIAEDDFNAFVNFFKEDSTKEFTDEHPEIGDRFSEIKLRKQLTSFKENSTIEIEKNLSNEDDSAVFTSNLKLNPEYAKELKELEARKNARIREYLYGEKERRREREKEERAAMEEQRREKEAKRRAEIRAQTEELRARIEARQAEEAARYHEEKERQETKAQADRYRELFRKAGYDYSSVSDKDIVTSMQPSSEAEKEQLALQVQKLEEQAKLYDQFAITMPKENYQNESRWHEAVVVQAKEAMSPKEGKTR